MDTAKVLFWLMTTHKFNRSDVFFHFWPESICQRPALHKVAVIITSDAMHVFRQLAADEVETQAYPVFVRSWLTAAPAAQASFYTLDEALQQVTTEEWWRWLCLSK